MIYLNSTFHLIVILIISKHVYLGKCNTNMFLTPLCALQAEGKSMKMTFKKEMDL